MKDWLIDKSAIVRLASSPDSAIWGARSKRGLIRVATPTILETGYSARDEQDWVELVEGFPMAWFPLEYLTPQAERRAIETQHQLAVHGHHRAPSVADLLIAAIAEVGSLTVLHVDKDFELIAEVTHQPVERLRTGENS